MSKNAIIALLSSLLLHGLLGGVIFLCWDSSHVLQAGHADIPYISSYLSPYRTRQKKARGSKQLAHASTKKTTTVPVHQKQIHPRHFHQHSIRSHSQAALAGGTFDQKGRNALLLLLHRHIAAHQYYPSAAQFFHETGTARVAFRLMPTGKLTNVHVIKSSGSSALDKAAVASVKAIAPEQAASLYLKAPEDFVVAVKYSS